METTSVRSKLDKLIGETKTYDKNLIPKELLNNINKWQWGKYGWISPVSLIVTASWIKAFLQFFFSE